MKGFCILECSDFDIFCIIMLLCINVVTQELTTKKVSF